MVWQPCGVAPLDCALLGWSPVDEVLGAGVVVCGVSGVDGVFGVDGVVVCGVVGAVVAGGLVGGVICAIANGAAIREAAAQRTRKRFMEELPRPRPGLQRDGDCAVSGSGPTIQQPSARASA